MWLGSTECCHERGGIRAEWKPAEVWHMWQDVLLPPQIPAIGSRYCNFCSKHLITKEKLNTHSQKVHTCGPRKQPMIYLSETCEMFFKDRSNLSQYMGYRQKVLKSRMPVPKKPPCNNCQKPFKWQGNLKRRINSKHKKKVFGCQCTWLHEQVLSQVCKKFLRRKLSLLHIISQLKGSISPDIYF